MLEQFQDTAAHAQNISLRANDVLSMSDLPDALMTVVTAWENLPDAVKVGILAMVQVASQAGKKAKRDVEAP